ncbi:MAG: glycosyltransferase family 2 protein [Thalassovita sp.]|nr:glycosyltransferase family 2 protein [Thalassovita sp.]
MGGPKWGVVATIKAPVTEILDFCAHHLDIGAHRMFIYLDDDNHDAFRILSDHPKIRPSLTDDAYWKRLGMKRRVKHQSRQFENARHAYARAGDVDWLTHIDVDEFLWPLDRSLADQLADLPSDCLCARVRPLEALAGGEGGITHFKGFSLKQPRRRNQTARIYPTWGKYLNGGFLSHVAGKMIYRTGVEGLKVQIHNVFVGEKMNPGHQELERTQLLHMHAKSWEDFITAFRYRLEKGSYRSELKPNMPREEGGLSLHELFNLIHEEDGETGLRAFYDEVCTASPALMDRLRAEGHLCNHALRLPDKRSRHFPAGV